MQQSIEGFIWLDWVVDKLLQKHGVDPEEAEEAFFNKPYKRHYNDLSIRLDSGRTVS